MKDVSIKQAEKSKRTKKKILDAAIKMAKDEKFVDISIRAICQNAGISIGAFYHHYKSKDNLINEAFEAFDQTLSTSKLIKLDEMDPVEAVKAVLLEQTEFTANEGYAVITEYYRALLQSESRHAVSKNREYYVIVNKYVMAAQENGALTKEVNHSEIAETLIKFVRGNLLDWCLHDGDYDVLSTTAEELDRIIDSFRVEK